MTTLRTNLSHDQATKLATLVNALRPDWDKAGILDALGKARHLGTATEVSIAAIRCAESAKNRTPAVIALDGEHWRPPKADPGAMGDRRINVAGRCDKCGRLHPAADPCIPPREETQAAAARRASEARALMAQAKAGHCSHGVAPRDCADHRNPEPEETAP